MIFNKDFFKYVNEYIDDSSIDAIITDPPYIINYKEWDKGDFETFTTKWIELCLKKLKPNGTLWSFMAKDNLFTHKKCSKGLVNILDDLGFVHLENWITWSRPKGRGSSKHLKSQREEIIHFTLKENDYKWTEMKMLREVIAPYMKDGRPRGWFVDETGQRVRWTGLGNSWVYSAPQWNGISEKQFHPSQKPVMMMERLVRLCTNENDIVLDPFCGSGSTGVACKLSNRNFMGFELDKKYFDFSLNRMKNFNKFQYPGYNKTLDIDIINSMNGLDLTKREINHIKNNIPPDIMKNNLNKFLK